MEEVYSKCQNSFIPQFKDNKTMQYYNMCDTCRPRKSNINFDCINNDKFSKLITALHESIETNTQDLKVVEGEICSITYLIQKMNSDLVKLEVKSGVVTDIDIQNEIVRLKDRMSNLETVFNTRFNIIENSINELLKTILQKLLDFHCFLYTYFYIYRI